MFFLLFLFSFDKVIAHSNYSRTSHFGSFGRSVRVKVQGKIFLQKNDFLGFVHTGQNLKSLPEIVKINAFSISRLACSLPFFGVFSDFADLGGFGGLQPQTIFSEITLAKKL